MQCSDYWSCSSLPEIIWSKEILLARWQISYFKQEFSKVATCFDSLSRISNDISYSGTNYNLLLSESFFFLIWLLFAFVCLPLVNDFLHSE